MSVIIRGVVGASALQAMLLCLLQLPTLVNANFDSD